MAKKQLPPVVLPVVRIERVPVVDGGPPDLTNVVDINAFRYRRERAAQERREKQTLLPCDCGDEA